MFLKLGGSLITDKSAERTARQAVIDRIAAEIAAYMEEPAAEPLLLGHGSGSFGHAAAAQHGTHHGVDSPEGWRGFIEVWKAASKLHRIVLRSLHDVSLPAISMPPSASAVSLDGQIHSLAIVPIEHALAFDLLPVVYGDVAFDRSQGAAILSTESIFSFLASELKPTRILLAGIEAGIFADYPSRQHLLDQLGPNELESIDLKGAETIDVTGGMLSKVEQSLTLIKSLPGLEIRIFSGEDPGSILKALQGETLGTLIRSG
ncbi:MAG: isopentenyl phosphate kinase [Anaerolineales bacterium]